MKINPKKSDFEVWSQNLPALGDLVFLRKGAVEKFEALHFPVLSPEELLLQNPFLWTLQHRSWYAYASSRAEACFFMAPGGLENLPIELIRYLADEQVALEVPTVLLNQTEVSGHLRLGNGWTWITSQFWMKSSAETRLKILKSWFIQNEIEEYETIDPRDLSGDAEKTLRSSGLSQFVGTFSAFSGPNCFAAVAAAISSRPTMSLAPQWLHWEPLKRLLIEMKYHPIESNDLKAGDVLVFEKKGAVIHAAFSISESVYFEKPGQDFYEPYRLVNFKDWQGEQEGARLTLWRA